MNNKNILLRGKLEDCLHKEKNDIANGPLAMSIHNIAVIMGTLLTNDELKQEFISSIFVNFNEKIKFTKMKAFDGYSYEGLDITDANEEDKYQSSLMDNINNSVDSYSKKTYLETTDKMISYVKMYKSLLSSNHVTFLVDQNFINKINALRIRNGYTENQIKIIVFQNFLMGFEDRTIIERILKSSLIKICKLTSYFTGVDEEVVFSTLCDNTLTPYLHICINPSWGGLVFRTNMEKLYTIHNEKVKTIKLKTNLTINDYPEYTDGILNILNILTETNNSNIFIHGGVGVGKTELAKYICHTLDYNVIDFQKFIVQNKDIDDPDIKTSLNKAMIRLIEYILIYEKELQNTIILIDEAEDLFFEQGHELSKKLLNEFLDTNINKLFISNYEKFGLHIMRRFSYILNIKNKFKSTKINFIKTKFKNKLSDEIINKIVKHPDITMHTLKLTEKVVKLNKKYTGEDILKYLNNYLKSIKVKKIKKDITITESMKDYNYDLINYTSETDLEYVINSLNEYDDKDKNIRILLNGNPGTGKSEFCKYFAERLDMEVHKVYCSNILGMFVGQSEKNIKKAFEKAKKKNKILIFDEIDALLSSREGASKNWEVSQVNEFLQRLEDYDGIVLATTNTQKLLDKAAIRRFDVKIEFKPLDINRLKLAFKHFAKLLGIKKIETNIIEELERLNNVCLGDFSVIMRNNKFNPVTTARKMLNMLKEEINNKNESRSVGFR